MKNKPVALILGASGSIGYASAMKLAQNNFDLILVHRDSKSNSEKIKKSFESLKSYGAEVLSINTNATTDQGMARIIDSINQVKLLSVNVFIHAIADANIGDAIGDESSLSKDDYLHTINAMTISFSKWTNLLLSEELLHSGARIIGFTSEGSNNVLPKYVAAGISKSGLETLSKYMAIDLAKKGITVNLINSGIIDSNAVRKMPYGDKLLATAIKRNPFGRLTSPEDVAKVVGFLASEDSSWITGEIIRVDGGEQLISI